MRVISLTEETRLTGGYAATIGFFDGVHRGHRYVLQQLCRQAEDHCLPSMAITFDRHPRQVVDATWHPLLLTTLDEKIELLRQTGVDLLVVLSFDEAMARLSARDFMRLILKERLGVSLLLTGYDNRFGHRTADSREDFNDYVRYGGETGIEVTAATVLPGGHVSSSSIRRLLNEGNVGEAAKCLGRPYSLSGTVGHGFEQGRKMGFPTANMTLDACRLIPADGVYAVSVHLSPLTSHLSPLIGITNIGMRPTFDGHQRTIETHILDFEGDLYGRDISVGFVARLRGEQHFESPEELAQQMARDAETTRSFFLTTNDTIFFDHE